MRLGVIQMSPGADKAANLAQAERLIDSCLAADRPGLVALPEMWTCLGGDRAGKFAAAEQLPPPGSGQAGGPAYEFLRGLARRHGIYVHGGSIGETDPEGAADRICNTTLVFDPDGAELARYRKLHLFDITTPDGQGYKESSTYAPGARVVTCRVGAFTLGLAICYDLRFAELFLALRQAGADLIVLPAAFTVQTGRDHWEPLLRARAIETQCWLAAAATVGAHTDIGRAGPSERHTYGHSLIADPWGHIVARASDGPGWTSARLDPALTARIRRDMPVLQHRRLPNGAVAAAPVPPA
jgi:nitrilase